MRTFKLQRTTDVTGVSGTGVVAEGVQFSDGVVALRWLGETATTVVYAEIDHVRRIHGHDGATHVRWDDEGSAPEAQQEAPDAKDMYGHLIHVSDRGQGGFGISLTWQRKLGEAATPVFSFFHESDGYRQALFSVDFECQCLEGHDLTPRVVNIFHDRVADVLSGWQA